MDITDETIKEQNLTCLMITHHLEDALKYGNRLLVLHQGKISYDISGEDKKKLTKEELLTFFNDIQ